MKSMFKVFTAVCTIALAISFTNCGSSSSGSGGSGGTTTATTEEAVEGNAQNLVTTATGVSSSAQAVASLSSTPPSLRFAMIQELTTTQSCSEGGSFTLDIPDSGTSLSMSYDQCVENGVTTDGTLGFSFTEDATGFSGTISFTDFTTDDEDLGTFAIDGTITMGYTDSTQITTFGYDITTNDVDNNELVMTGNLEIDANSIMNGTLDMTYLEETYSCVFEDFNLETATEAEWAAACSEAL